MIKGMRALHVLLRAAQPSGEILRFGRDPQFDIITTLLQWP
jgi:hypothetical protein